MSVNIVISNRGFLIKDATLHQPLTGAMGLDFKMSSFQLLWVSLLWGDMF